MDLFIKSGKNFNMGSVEETFQKLPLGTYILEMDANTGAYFLEKTEELKYPSKLYGNFDIIDRWINTYEKREGNLGVLLSGLKGSGKTITAKMLALRANKPVILIKAPFSGLGLKNFLADKRLGDCVIFIDEFEKIYEDYGNVDFLEILDGTASTHHLFIFTVNNESISSKMINRPSRIFYRKRYEGLDETIVKEVGEDLLENKDHLANLIDTMDDVEDLSYDILVSVIGEMNRYDIKADDAIAEMCVDKRDRLFYVFQKLNVHGTTYYAVLDGGRGKDYLNRQSVLLNLYGKNGGDDTRYSGVAAFGSYIDEDMEYIEQMKRARYRLFVGDMNKVSKSYYITDPSVTDGNEIIMAESIDKEYFDTGTVMNEDDFRANILKDGDEKTGPSGRRASQDWCEEPMEFCAG